MDELEKLEYRIAKLEKTVMYLTQIIMNYDVAKNVKDKPTCIIAKTIKGKGVSYMENDVKWHGIAPNEEQYQLAMKELGGAI